MAARAKVLGIFICLLGTIAVSVAEPAAVQAPEGLVMCRGGIFNLGELYGRNADIPVAVSGFFIGRFEVTQREWSEVMGGNPSRFKGDDLPVEGVSWYDAIEYCNRRSQKEGLRQAYRLYGALVECDWTSDGYRLPTEAEWEFAAKGGPGGNGAAMMYSGSDRYGSVAWFSGNSGGVTHPVGKKDPNSLGLYDLSGNVWEWCWDWYADYPAGIQADPRGPVSGEHKVIRGGGILRGGDVGIINRDWNEPDGYESFIGLRIVREIGGQDQPGLLGSMHTSPAPQGFKPLPSPASAYVVSSHQGYVRVGPGEFEMGSPDQEPGRNDDEARHRVKITTAFWIAKHELTQAEWIAVMGENPSAFPSDPRQPVENVSWYAAIAYCNLRSIREGLKPCYSLNGSRDPETWGRIPERWITLWTKLQCDFDASGYRLPTEAEWEYACRAGSVTAMAFGSKLDSRQANFNGTEPYEGAVTGPFLNKPVPVGSYAPNGWGLHDMHGNVAEWCWDRYGPYSTALQSDPWGPLSGDARVVRGGAFALAGTSLRSSWRAQLDAETSDALIGLRLVLGK